MTSPNPSGVTVPAPGYYDPHNFNPRPIPAPYLVTPPSTVPIVAWNYDIVSATGATGALTSGTIYLIRIDLPGSPVTVTNLLYIITTGGSTLTSAQNFAGLYDHLGNQIGVTTDQTTNFASTGLGGAAGAGVPLTGGPFTGSWPFVYVAIVSNGTTPPAFQRGTGTGSSNLGAVARNLRWATNVTGQTSLPATVAYGSNISAGANTLWAGLS